MANDGPPTPAGALVPEHIHRRSADPHQQTESGTDTPASSAEPADGGPGDRFDHPEQPSTPQLLTPQRVTPQHGMESCFVIFNPVRVSPDFRSLTEAALTDQGWRGVVWLPTTEDDPGQEMTRQAVAEEARLVIVAGGDGTVRIVADELADTGIPLGVVAVGTGNLLARNLGLPLDEAAAVDVAVGHQARTIDLIRLHVDNDPDTTFAVMAGVGVDAVIMEATDSSLKRRIGSLAYFVAAARQVGHKPFKVTVRVDDGPPVRRRAVVCVIGSVGQLQANIELIPGARPDDGVLNVLIASPRSLLGWIKLIAGVLRRRLSVTDGLDHLTGRKVEMRLAQPNAYQMDGDLTGRTTTLIATVRPAALIVKIRQADHASHE